jgi:hypothetical protein
MGWITNLLEIGMLGIAVSLLALWLNCLKTAREQSVPSAVQKMPAGKAGARQTQNLLRRSDKRAG